MKTLKKKLFSSIKPALYYLSLITPKDNSLWLLGAWSGQRYADNSRYLYEHLMENEKNIKAYWLTSNYQTYLELLSKKQPAAYFYSFKAVYLLLRAGVVIFSNNLRRDVAFFGVKKTVFCMHLWHGSPLKKIVCDNPADWKVLNSKSAQKRKPYRSRGTEKFNALATPSFYFQKIFQSAFRLQCNHFPVLGNPRVDRLLCDIKPYNQNAPKCLYAPTYRGGEIKTSQALHDSAMPKLKEWEDIDRLLTTHNATMDLQLHPSARLSSDINLKQLHHIDHAPKHNNLSVYLQSIDILITDYSGLIFDFLLTKKPLICMIGDIALYNSKERQLYRDHSEIPGIYICYSWKEVQDCLKKILENGPDISRAISDEAMKEFYEFRDTNASQRITEYIKQHQHQR